MNNARKARAVGINHVALEVGDLEQALAFYGSFLDFTLRGRHDNMAFIDLGDQFIALCEVPEQDPDKERHFGLVVDDKAAVRAAVDAMGLEIVSDRFLDFLDPWGNRIEIVGYEGIQFSKTPSVLRGMELEHLGKSDAALQELAEKGMAPSSN